MKKKKLALSLILFATASVCLAGGTFAWYLINSNINLSIKGQTATVPSELLVAWSEDNRNYSNFDYYVDIKGLNNRLSPVTSGSFDGTKELILKKAPTMKTPLYQNAQRASLAKDGTGEYISYYLRFKGESSTPIYLDRNALHFEYTDEMADDAVYNSLRIAFEDVTSGKRILLNPSLEKSNNLEPILTKVGGNADLDSDSTFDYTIGEDNYYHEVFYGEGEVNYRKVDKAMMDENFGYSIPDSNGNWHGENVKHKKPTEYDTREGTEIITDESTIPNQISYSVAYFDQEENYLTTLDSEGIATLKITFWFEGWDLDCTNILASDSKNNPKQLESTIGFKVL